ncbi:MAG: multiheme C-type cytochrome [Desulfotalea sp.]|nr:MAG: multiheme C-type cytochrome [Desulfotalea sp.]
MMVLLFMPVVVHADNNAKAVHPELSEQEMYISCADCHKEATPELEKQWYDSSHGIAIVKCYQCHGTFGTFKLTPTRTDCAVCHMDQLTKCSTDTACWDCHTPHLFKAKK